MNNNFSPESNDELSIAIVGMSCRFPGARNIAEFWQNLVNGVESITYFADDELKSEGVSPALLSNPNYIKARANLADIEQFDASFFGFTPREAEMMDPQHRFFLECAWEAMENSAYDSQFYLGQVGVFAGVGMNSYILRNLFSNPNLIKSLNDLQISIGNDKDFVPTQVSYKLNLKGPSVNVNTACSSSLVAVHMACQSLLNYQCDMALAGGVSIVVPQKEGYLYQEGGIVSPDGHCRAFDAQAKGCIDGSGVGIVVLKRLEDAVTQGDNILAVIKSSAINNDGSLKVGFTAPSIEGQAAVISEALAIADIAPETVTYVETHGTGTALGDPIEISALTQAFRTGTEKKGFCGIGSVKTNIGHLGSAAGVASLIKTVLALQHQQIPSSLHFEQPNPKIDFANSPFYVNQELSPWETGEIKRRAGVSSFGLGGTNAHVILEEAPIRQMGQGVQAFEASSKDNPLRWGDREMGRKYNLLLLSAKTSSALETATTNLVNHLKQHPEINLADTAYTLQVGRRDFTHRRAVVAKDISDAIVALQDPKRLLSGIEKESDRPIVFMFTGLGTQYVNMAQELYQLEPTFRENVDLCCKILKPLLGIDLKDLLYPDCQQIKPNLPLPNLNGDAAKSGLDLHRMLGRDQQPTDQATQTLNKTCYAQPAIYVIEYALAKLWQSWGVFPDATIGYSIGEYVSATLAGVFSLEDALALVAKRASLIEDLPGGAMLAVPLSEAEVRPLLGEHLSISAINGEKLCVVGGSKEAIEELSLQLSAKGLAYRPLQTSHAFHSHMMKPLAEPFTEILTTFNLQPPKIPFISNVTGTWITASEAVDVNYWTRHLCQTVRFADGVKELWNRNQPILLEIGPGQTLSSLVLQYLDSKKEINKIVLPSLSDSYNQQSDLAFLLDSLGKLWLSGVKIDWSNFYAYEQRNRLPLPTYPFESQRFWIEPVKQTDTANTRSQISPTNDIFDKKSDITNWFYIPSWKRSIASSLKPGKIPMGSSWLVFVEKYGLGEQLVKRLEAKGQEVIIVKVGTQFAQSGERIFTINPQNKDNYNTLIEAILKSDNTPTNIVHLWSVNNSQKSFEETQNLGFYSLLFLTQALAESNYFDKLEITVVSNKIMEVTGEEELCPDKATILGAIKVIPQEYRNLICRHIDLVLPKNSQLIESKIIDPLLVEITEKSEELVIALRNNYRWVQTFESVKLNNSDRIKLRLRENGVYLITGGLGSLGLILAEYLVQNFRAKVVLIGRSTIPSRNEWEKWLATHDNNDSTSLKLRKLQELDKIGAEYLIISADVANQTQMQAALTKAEEKFGQINGVIHAAGVVTGNSISTIAQISKTECEEQFKAKVHGTLVLQSILHNKKLDFCLLTSSLTPILGGLSLIAYAAANCFIDTLVRQQNLEFYIPWIGVNLGDLEQNSKEENQINFGANNIRLAIKANEIIEVFQNILSQDSINQIIVFPGNLQAHIDQWINFKTLPEKATVPQNNFSSIHQRPNLANVYVAPENEIEQTLANIWQEFLGIQQVGIHDNFFELGGNSLLGTQIISRIREAFELDLPLRSLFEQPTIADMAKFIESSLSVNVNLETTTTEVINNRIQIEL